MTFLINYTLDIIYRNISVALPTHSNEIASSGDGDSIDGDVNTDIIVQPAMEIQQYVTHSSYTC